MKTKQQKALAIAKAYEMNEIIIKCDRELHKYPKIEFYISNSVMLNDGTRLDSHSYSVEYTI